LRAKAERAVPAKDLELREVPHHELATTGIQPT
jgi:hypothetical protein